MTAHGDSARSESAAQLNAFFVVPYSSLHETTLQKNGVPFFREGEELVVYGSAAEKFAHMFNAEVRRASCWRSLCQPHPPRPATHSRITKRR